MLAAMRLRPDWPFEAVLLVAMWSVVALVYGFDAFPVSLAAIVTFRIVFLDWKGYRLVTRGRSWEPSKRPEDYR